MRVAIISEWYKPRLGGIEIFLADLTAKLSAAGHAVEVLTPMPGAGEINGVPVTRLCDMSREDGGYRHPPPRSAANGRDFLFQLDLYLGRQRPRALERLRQALASGGYDVVHVHMANTPFTYLAVRTAIDLGLGVVATFHPMVSQTEQPLAWAAGRLLGTRGWSRRVYLTAVSSAAAEARKSMLGDARVGILPNGLDGRLWDAVRQRRQRRRATVRIELVSALRLHPRKRPLLLLDAVAALGPTPDVRLRIAGDGPLRAAMQRRIAVLGLESRVKLCGQVTREGLADLIAEADLFLMPTRHESFGIAVLEARVAGVPVLAMQSSGARDFLTDGADSLLAADDAGFRAALGQFVRDSQLRARLDTGAAAPLAGYGWDDIVARCESAYRGAIGLVRR